VLFLAVLGIQGGEGARWTDEVGVALERYHRNSSTSASCRFLWLSRIARFSLTS
jgi:hypothetical protein